MSPEKLERLIALTRDLVDVTEAFVRGVKGGQAANVFPDFPPTVDRLMVAAALVRDQLPKGKT